MKKVYVLLFFVYLSYSQAQNTFQKTFSGGPDIDIGAYIQQTSDKGFIITGMTVSNAFYWWVGTPPGNHFLSYLIKTDSIGDTLWTKILHYTDFNIPSSVQVLPKGFMIAGTAYNWQSSDSSNIYLIQTDQSGVPLWTMSYNSASSDKVFAMKKTSDKGFILAGTTNGSGSGNYDALLIKTDSTGNIMWSKTYGSAGYEAAKGLDVTNTGGYVITGETNTIGNSDAFIMRLDATGSILWSNNWGSGARDDARSVVQTSDLGFVFCGVTEGYGAGREEGFAAKVDSSGLILWAKTYGNAGADRCESVQQTSDQGLILSGTTTTDSIGDAFDPLKKMLVIRTYPNGDTAWTSSFQSPNGYTEGYFAQETTDKGYIISGASEWFNPEIYLVKTDSNGNGSCDHVISSLLCSNAPINTALNNFTASISNLSGNLKVTQYSSGALMWECSAFSIPDLEGSHAANLYPNPSQDHVTINASQPIKVVEVQNIMGAIVLRESTEMNSIVINTEVLAPGLYIVRVNDEVLKMIKQ